MSPGDGRGRVRPAALPSVVEDLFGQRADVRVHGTDHRVAGGIGEGLLVDLDEGHARGLQLGDQLLLVGQEQLALEGLGAVGCTAAWSASDSLFQAFSEMVR